MKRLSAVGAAALFALTACSMFSSGAPLRRLDVAFSDPSIPLPYEVLVTVDVRGPDGAEVQATGDAHRGGVVATLCTSLCRSLQHRGCEATRSDLTPATAEEGPEQKLRRAMQQTVVLPEGWTFVAARSRKFPESQPGPERGAGTHLLFTMRGVD
ncbi:MAG: hypothetical protein KAI24_16990 [Planctomycetes bacterium]|nr:hypothetical protein [Planctomycetota bacterium]